jgi:hypothetical protein
LRKSENQDTGYRRASRGGPTWPEQSTICESKLFCRWGRKYTTLNGSVNRFWHPLLSDPGVCCWIESIHNSDRRLQLKLASYAGNEIWPLPVYNKLVHFQGPVAYSWKLNRGVWAAGGIRICSNRCIQPDPCQLILQLSSMRRETRLKAYCEAV